MRIHRHITELAGSGLVLVGFLLAAMALSAVPALVLGLTHHGQQAQPPAPGVSAGRGAS